MLISGIWQEDINGEKGDKEGGRGGEREKKNKERIRDRRYNLFFSFLNSSTDNDNSENY